MLLVSQVYACAISPDGTFVATGGEDVRLCITNIATLAKVFKIKFTTQVRACLFFFVLTISSR